MIKREWSWGGGGGGVSMLFAMGNNNRVINRQFRGKREIEIWPLIWKYKIWNRFPCLLKASPTKWKHYPFATRHR